ncbi:MAG: SHOCT domain-containing protein [Desulfobacterales bacterium]|nr:SHOCT domain-containing protein [Desulfobacterales bacterium]
MKSESFFEKQMYIVKNLAIFYIIIIALFSIPLIGTFVVFIIKGIMDLKYLVAAIGGAIVITFLSYALIFIRRAGKKIQEDGISFINGVKEISYNPDDSIVDTKLITDYHASKEQLNIADAKNDRNKSSENLSIIISQLKELSDLKQQNIIDEDEFQRLKQRLLNIS